MLPAQLGHLDSVETSKVHLSFACRLAGKGDGIKPDAWVGRAGVTIVLKQCRGRHTRNPFELGRLVLTFVDRDIMSEVCSVRFISTMLEVTARQLSH